MEEIEEADNYSILTDYDDGVVCFGKVTQSQIERYKRLPRHTVLPSDIESIRESISNSGNVDEDDGNNQSTSTLDKSGKKSIIPDDDSFNDVTRTTNFLDNEEATSTMKLKQSFTHDSSSNFSSPCRTKFIPTKNLIDTETINRYIRMESVSPNETFSEDHNKSAIAKDEMASYIDVEEAELSTNNFVDKETSSCRSSVSSVIERNLIKNHEIPDSDDNICTLKPCSQQEEEEEEDMSYCYDSEFEDTIEYSIVPDKYSITPGKQRLFDSRHAKSSIRAKTVVSSAPFMDKIEETTTPLPKALNSSSMSFHNVSYEPLENDNVERKSVSSLSCKSSEHYRPTSSDWGSKSKKSADKTVEDWSDSTKFNHSASENDSIYYASYRKSAFKNMESSLHDSVVEQTYGNNLQNKSTLTNTSIDFNIPLEIVNEASTNTSNIITQIFIADKSMNNTSNTEFAMADINDYNDENVSEAALTEIKSTNSSVLDTVINETMSSRLLPSNGENKVLDKSCNETRHANYTSNITEPSFDVEKSVTNKSNILISSVDINVCSNEEESEAMEVDIKSTNTSIVDNVVDEPMSISMLSTNDKSKDLNKSPNETSEALDNLNVSEQSFGVENSISIIPNILVPNVEINSYYEGESEAMEVDIKSTNTSVVDNVVDETMCTSMLFTNDKSKDLNKSSNETRQAENTLNVAEQSFDVEKSISSTSNIMETTAEINGFNKVEEAVIKSSDDSNVANIFDETMCTSMLFTNDKSQVMNKSLNEISQAKDTLNVAEQSFGIEKCVNVLPNIIIPMTDNNNFNNVEESDTKDASIKSTNTSIVDDVIDETVCTSMLSTNDKSKDLNKLSTETDPTKDSLNVTKQSFYDEKSLDKMVLSPLNSNDASLLSNFQDNTLKYSTDIEIPCSDKVDDIKTIEISETNENILEDPSHRMRKYLEFEQTIYNMCNDISSDTNQNNYNDQTLENISMIEQTQCSDLTVSMKDDDNFSSSNNSLRSKLSVIIENRTLEENCNDTIEQNEHLECPINDTKTTSILVNNVNEIQDDVKLNISTNQSQVESELNKTVNKFEIKTKLNKSTNYDITLDENLDKIKLSTCSMSSDELSRAKSCISAEIKGFLNDKSAENSSTSINVNEICSNQNILNNSSLQQPLIPENMTSNPDVTAIKCTQNSANAINSNFEQNKFLNNDVQQPDLLSANTNIYDNSLDEYNKLEEMFYLEENKKLPTFDYKTPKVQKLLDFSIMQQSSTSTMLKQKLLNFSIVDQTPCRKSTQLTYLDENAIGIKDTLIDFSAVGQMLDLDVTLPDKIDFENSSKDSLLKNLSKISAPDVELLADESIISNSCLNNLSLNQTITDTTNLNLSTYSGEINKSKDNIDEKNSKETSVKSSDNGYCSILSINEQFKTDKPSGSFDKTIEQADLELSYTTESKQNKSCDKPCESETTTEAFMCSSNIHVNQSFKKTDSTNNVMDSNQLPAFNSSLYAIKDFSIVEEKTLQLPESKENTNSTLVGSDLNVSNLIEMSVVPAIDIKSNDQSVVSLDNPVIVVTSDEKSINSSSDEINSTAIHIEEHIFSHNPEFLTDIQMNDISLLESSEKSSVGESFHSIELDQLQEDNKRKSETDQKYPTHEKKMKVEATEEPSTPMSMLYKLRNMFKSSEKPQNIKINKENDSKLESCHQELNVSGVEQNKNKSCYKKPEILIKSKIPCKISDKSVSTNCEFNSSSSSLNDSIKPKKGIPRFIGAAPVLSDVSNSSIRKCTESRIPSKFKK